MKEQVSMKTVVTWNFSVKWNGAWRTSPKSYSSYEELLSDLGKFCAKFEGKYLNVTINRNLSWEQA